MSNDKRSDNMSHLAVNDYGHGSVVRGGNVDRAVSEALSKGVWMPGISATDRNKPKDQGRS